jgi:hypothetical protein
MDGDGGLEALEQFFIEILFGFGGGGSQSRSVGELATKVAVLGLPDGIRATLDRKGSGPVVYKGRQTLIRGKTKLPLIVRPAKKR